MAFTFEAVSDNNTKRILVLNSYHEGYYWTDRIMDGIHTVIDPRDDVELFINYMDTKRISDDAHFQNLFNLYKDKYSLQKVDAIISTDDHALDFLLKYRDELFPDVPVIFNGINDYHPSKIAGQKLITGLAETYDIRGTLELMLRLHPWTETIVVVSDNTITGRKITGLVENASLDYVERIRFLYFSYMAKDEISQALGRLSSDTLVLWASYLRTPDGLSISSRESVRLITTSSNVPVYCIFDVVGLGVVGGKVTSPNEQGNLAAEMVLRILDGEDIDNIPVITNPSLINLFDYNAMQRFGISENELPSESVILNRPYSVYEKYKWTIWGVLVFLLLLIAIIISLGYYIQKRKRAEQALQESEERFRTLYYENPSMYFTIDAGGIIISVNQYGAIQLGYTIDELTGKPVTDVFYEEDRESARNYVEACLAQPEEIHRWNLRKVRKDGSILWVREAARLIQDSDGQPRILIVCEDITESYELSEKLIYLASHDALTGLANRRGFEQRAEQLITSSHHEGYEHAFCFMDLDQFKIINDTCGHAAGDEMLRQLTSVLHDCVRQRDILARLGGDEFGILIEHCTLEHAQRIATSVKNAIQDYQFIWEGQSFKVGVSIGLVAINRETTSLGELLMDADAACYIAKEMGRNRIHIYHVKDSEIAKRHGEMQWVAQIHDALEHDRFCLYAQTIIPLDDNSYNYYEVLIRLEDENKKIIEAGVFLAAAERYNLISKLDRWVIHETFSLLVNNPEFLNHTTFCSINISGQSLTENDFMDFVLTQFDESGVEGSKICFEITETAAISSMKTATKFISVLKGIGCRFALDDFGSGLSSFGYLKNLSVDYLKIDGMFVRDMIDDPIDHAMVKSINEIGHVMGMKTIAEFVENDMVGGMLREMGVNYAQGYGISKPQLLEELIEKQNKVTKIGLARKIIN